MQSWGTESRFGVRDTGREPSKSGVIGLLCAALGRSRSAPLNDLIALCMGVRVDREGTLAVDYHTAQQVLKASGGIKSTELSRRYYLADATFLVGMQGQTSLLKKLHAALQAPHWLLYLGRKAFIPGAPVWLRDGLRISEKLEKALGSFPLLVETKADLLRIVLDDPNGEQVRSDVPISFAERRFFNRRVHTGFISPPQEEKGMA